MGSLGPTCFSGQEPRPSAHETLAFHQHKQNGYGEFSLLFAPQFFN